MRAILLSHAYVPRATRGKLRALNALGCTVAAAVPARWPDPRGLATTVTEWADDAGVGIVPIGVRGDPAAPENVQWDRRSLRRLLKDSGPISSRSRRNRGRARLPALWPRRDAFVSRWWDTPG